MDHHAEVERLEPAAAVRVKERPDELSLALACRDERRVGMVGAVGVGNCTDKTVDGVDESTRDDEGKEGTKAEAEASLEAGGSSQPDVQLALSLVEEEEGREGERYTNG